MLCNFPAHQNFLFKVKYRDITVALLLDTEKEVCIICFWEMFFIYIFVLSWIFWRLKSAVYFVNLFEILLFGTYVQISTGQTSIFVPTENRLRKGCCMYRPFKYCYIGGSIFFITLITQLTLLFHIYGKQT